MDLNDLRAIELVRQLQALSPEDAETAVRITVRNATGRLVGEALLTEEAAAALTDAVHSMNEYAADTEAEQPSTPDLDPLLIASIEDHFDTVDPKSYLQNIKQAADEDAAVAAYEALVLGEWDGEL